MLKYFKASLITKILLLTKSKDKSGAHLSKGPSDLKQNGKQENLSFSGPGFHGLSSGVICFVPSVSSENHLQNG